MPSTENKNASWVNVESATSTGLVWRCTKIEHLTPELNQGKRNIFLYLYHNGQQVYTDLSIKWGWDGQHADEQQQPKKLDKKPPDPSTDIPIDRGQHIWLEVLDPNGYPSDRVSNLHADLPSDGQGSYLWHHSYQVRYDLLSADDTIDEPEALTLESLDQRVKVLEAEKKA